MKIIGTVGPSGAVRMTPAVPTRAVTHPSNVAAVRAPQDAVDGDAPDDEEGDDTENSSARQVTGAEQVS